ncbi:DUF3150 domain-containing protein [Rheinheimera sp.]|uniref:DUF3150 domain-containing protein n=1 Tax=Rheinheimera sp. TaxID=1869214 RepID=UPI00404899CF
MNKSAVKEAQQNAKQASKSLSKNACLVSRPTISYPSGKMTVKEIESSSLANGTMIDGEEIDSSLQWFPSTDLQPFNTQRKQAYDLFDRVSVSVGAFNLVPLDKLQEVMAKLEDKRIRFLDTVSSTLARYDALIEKHCNDDGKGKKKKPKSEAIKSLIRKAATLNEHDFKAVFGFEVFPAMTIQPVFESDEEIMQQKAKESLWDETAKAAMESLKTTFKSEAKPTARAVNTLSRIRDKLVALSFLDDGIDKVIDCCDQVIQAMPKTGTLSDHEILVMTHFMSSVANVETLKATAAGDENNGIDMTRVFKMLLPEVIDEPVEVVEEVASAVSQALADEEFTSSDDLFDDDEWAQQQPAVTRALPTQDTFDWGGF